MKTVTLGGQPARVLVLIGTFNGEAWIRTQVESVLAQQDVEVQLLIGDDASDDNTWLTLEAGYGNDSRVRMCRWPEPSGSAGGNFRKLYAKAMLGGIDYVALCDQDDIWLSDKLVRAINALTSRQAQGYSCAVEAFWPNGRCKPMRQSGTERAADFLFEGAGQGCTFVTTAPFFARIQSFCIEHEEVAASLHYHDWLVYLLARAWDQHWVFDEKVGLQYRQHGGNEIGARGSRIAMVRRLDLIRSGWYATQLGAAAAIYEATGGNDPLAAQMIQSIRHGDGRNPMARLTFAGRVLKHGRRRMLDRIVVSIAALLGWI